MARDPDRPTRSRARGRPKAEPPPGERELLAAARAGDREAAEALVDRTYGMVYASLFKLTGGDQDLTSDLCQEAYRRAWQALPRFEGRSRISTWLYRIAYTTFLNHVRGPRRLVPLEDEVAAAVTDDDPSQEERLEAAARGRRARRAVLELDDPLRYTVTARYWGELTVKEIAEQEAVTPMAIRKRLHKAMRLLAVTLEEDA